MPRLGFHIAASQGCRSRAAGVGRVAGLAAGFQPCPGASAAPGFAVQVAGAEALPPAQAARTRSSSSPLWQRRCGEPGRPLLRESSAHPPPGFGPAPSIPTVSNSVSANEGKLLSCCFSAGHPPSSALHRARIDPTGWRLGAISLSCRRKDYWGPGAILLVTIQVLNKTLSTSRKATQWPRETVRQHLQFARVTVQVLHHTA